MSVIIRLQNLPWSANAADIRKYFGGLSIPEGGVHIVGGEQGDAFIAFSTDEDARQAMLIDGGKINEVKIKLLLSSRSEMQKVIETARQQALNLHSYLQMPAQPAVMPTMQSMAMMQPLSQIPMNVQPAPVQNTVHPFNPMNVAKPINNGLTNVTTTNQNQASPTSVSQEVVVDGDKPKSESDDEMSRKGSHRSRDSSGSRSRSPSRDRRDRRDRKHRDRRDRDYGRDRDRHRDRDRDRDRDRGRDRDRDRDRRRRSSSRDKHRSRRHRSKSRDRERSRRDSRDKDRHQERDRDRNRSVSKEMNGEAKINDAEKLKSSEGELTNIAPPPIPENDTSTPVGLMAKPVNPVIGFTPASGLAQPNLPLGTPFPPIPEPPRMPAWNFPGEIMGVPGVGAVPVPQAGVLPPPPMFVPPEFLVNPNFQPNLEGSSPKAVFPNVPRMEEPPLNHVDTKNELEEAKESTASTPKNCCIQIKNLSTRANYDDIHRFLHGLKIAPNGIKMINDDDGNRSGLAYVRLVNDSFKSQALRLNGRSIRETQVQIVHLDDYVYNEAIDNFQPTRPRNKQPQFKTIKLTQLPRYIKEKDVFNLFLNVHPSKILLVPNKSLIDAFVEFVSPQEAVMAISQRLKFGHHNISAEPVFENDPSLPFSPVGNMFIGDQPPVEPELIPIRQDPRKKGTSDKEAPIIAGRHHSEPLLETPVIPTDCLLVKGLPFKANDRDILDFFSDVGIVPSKIHIMFDKLGKPAGDAFCEFNTPDEASRGLVKQNAPMDRNIVSVLPVPRHDMLRALGIVNPPPQMMPPMMMGPPMGMPPRMPPPMQQPPVQPDGFHGPPTFPPAPHMAPDFTNDSINVDGFGRNGCVVSLENVPFSAGVEDILYFFKGFDLLRRNIIRRFDDNGRPTGDARVCLQSPSEAEKAVKQLDRRMIKNRIIYLSIVD